MNETKDLADRLVQMFDALVGKAQSGEPASARAVQSVIEGLLKDAFDRGVKSVDGGAP